MHDFTMHGIMSLRQADLHALPVILSTPTHAVCELSTGSLLFLHRLHLITLTSALHATCMIVFIDKAGQSNQSWPSSWRVQPPLHLLNQCFPHRHPHHRPTHHLHHPHTLRHLLSLLGLQSNQLCRVGLLLVGLLRPTH